MFKDKQSKGTIIKLVVNLLISFQFNGKLTASDAVAALRGLADDIEANNQPKTPVM
jgi:hypothetical protein